MIKYLGSKRLLVPKLGELASITGSGTALDLFTGTTRVAQEFKKRGIRVTTVDTARYSEIFSRCHIVADARDFSESAIQEELRYLSGLPGKPGYFTTTFCEKSRFFQPFNGEKIDAIRDAIEQYRGSSLYPILLTSLIYAADKVDSTTGVQMAYLKKWAPRSEKPLTLAVPGLYPGSGRAIRGDALKIAKQLEHVDFAYLDPPYNQHSYFGNYHIWETLVAWDAPEFYGIACKRTETKDSSAKSIFNRKNEMPKALSSLIKDVSSDILVLSYNNESWISLEELEDMCSGRERVKTLSFDSKRYIGAQIGIHDPQGKKVGKVSHLRNLEYLIISGPREKIDRI